MSAETTKETTSLYHAEFQEVDRPIDPPRRGRPISSAVVAVLDTRASGKAIAFTTRRAARRTQWSVSKLLTRLDPRIVARSSGCVVWCELRPTDDEAQS